jgi:hypothetical protein
VPDCLLERGEHVRGDAIELVAVESHARSDAGA